MVVLIYEHLFVCFVFAKGVKITSTKTQLPYDYYSIGICTPALEKIVYMSENLGEVLRGDRIVNTLYKVNISSSVFIFNWSVVRLKPLGKHVYCKLFQHNQ